MHLLQAGVNLVYIRDLLGHADIKTTEIYARADSEMKRAALQSVVQNIASSDVPSWSDNGELMAWLLQLGK